MREGPALLRGDGRTGPPVIMLRGSRRQQFSHLRDARVLNLGLGDVHRVVLEVVVEDAVADAVVLEARLVHRLLEVAVEAQHLAVEGHPRRLNRSDVGRRHRRHLRRLDGAGGRRRRGGRVVRNRDALVHVEHVRLLEVGQGRVLEAIAREQRQALGHDRELRSNGVGEHVVRIVVLPADQMA